MCKALERECEIRADAFFLFLSWLFPTSVLENGKILKI